MEDGIRKTSELVKATAEAFDAGGDLEHAVAIATAFLKARTGNHRPEELRHVLTVCESAIERWQRANARMMGLAMKLAGSGGSIQ